MASSNRPLAVVTGASSGIGKELALQLAERGYDLVVSSGGSELSEISSAIASRGGSVADEVTSDLATLEGAELLAKRVQALNRPVEVLALNAGVGRGGSFLEPGTLERELGMISLNCISTVVLAKRLLPDMAARKSGKVLITSSIASITPTPFEAIYGATKSFVKSFAESLYTEIKEHGITVTALMPGPTETNFFHRADMDDTQIGTSKKDNPADVARQGLDALFAGKDHIVAGSLKTKAQGALMENVLPETVKANLHKNRAAPGTAST